MKRYAFFFLVILTTLPTFLHAQQSPPFADRYLKTQSAHRHPPLMDPEHPLALATPQHGAQETLPISSLSTMQAANDLASHALRKCEMQRDAMTTPNQKQFAVCTGKAIQRIFKAADYPYTDLLETFVADLRENGQKLDDHRIQPSQANQAMWQAVAKLQKAEQDRTEKQIPSPSAH